MKKTNITATDHPDEPERPHGYDKFCADLTRDRAKPAEPVAEAVPLGPDGHALSGRDLYVHRLTHPKAATKPAPGSR